MLVVLAVGGGGAGNDPASFAWSVLGISPLSWWVLEVGRPERRFSDCSDASSCPIGRARLGDVQSSPFCCVGAGLRRAGGTGFDMDMRP